MASSIIVRDTDPMGEINTTPLIDVMLVLLIMFVITIPVATHSVTVDLPGAPPETPPTFADKNRLTITAEDTLVWNGTAVSEAELGAALATTLALPVEPELQFEPHANASYAASARTLRMIDAAQVTNFGFVGNERYAEFAAAPSDIDPTVSR